MQIHKSTTAKRVTHLQIKAFIICLFAYLSFAYLLIPSETRAQAKIPLVVAPARQEVRLNPGESKSLQVRFFNESSAPLSGNVGIVDFIVTGKEGQPVLLDDVNYPISNQYSGSSWVTLPTDKASIAPGDVLRINYKLNVPKDAKPGGRYVAVYFESESQIPQTSINQQISSTSTRIVALLYIRVNGPVMESAYIDLFGVPVFLQFGPVPVNFEVFNKGDYHITPTGQLVLVDWFGKQIDQIIIDQKNVFPDTKRAYEAKLGSTWMFGKYKVNLSAAYGESGKVLISSSDVWIIPVFVILAVALGIGIIILLGIYINKRLTAKQKILETKLEEEISEVEELKNKFKDKLPKK